MGEATLVTRLEASADVPLAAPAVWEALLDGTRWPDWLSAGDPPARAWRRHGILPRLDAVTEFRGNARQPEPVPSVGDMRQETAVVGVPFGFGARRITWRTVVTDVEFGRTLECESPSVGGYLMEWRLRLTVLPTGIQPLPSWFTLGANPVPPTDGPRVNERTRDAGSRVHVQLSYRPAGLFSRMYNRLRLRSILKERLGSWLSGLTHSLTLLADLESRAVGEPIRYMPEPPRPPRPSPTNRPPEPVRTPRQLPAGIAQRLASRAEARPVPTPQPSRQSPVAGMAVASGGGIVPPSTQTPATRAPDGPQRRQASGALGMETRARAGGPGGNSDSALATPPLSPGYGRFPTPILSPVATGARSRDQATTGWGSVSGTSAIATLELPDAPAVSSATAIRPVVNTPLLVVRTAQEAAYGELVATVIATTSPGAPDPNPSPLTATRIASPAPSPAGGLDAGFSTLVDPQPSSVRGLGNDQPWGEGVSAGGHVDHAGPFSRPIAPDRDAIRSAEISHAPRADTALNISVEVADEDETAWAEDKPANLAASTSSDVMSGVIAEVIARAMTLAPVVRIVADCNRPDPPLAPPHHPLMERRFAWPSHHSSVATRFASLANSEETPSPPQATISDASTQSLLDGTPAASLHRAPEGDAGVAETSLLLRADDAGAHATARDFMAWMSRNPGAVDGTAIAGFVRGALSTTEAVSFPVPVPPRPLGAAGNPASADA